MSKKYTRASVSDLTKNLRENLEGIRLIKRELMLRLALLGYSRHLDPSLELVAGLRKTDRDLDAAHRKLRKCEAASPDEDACLNWIRQLEDQRFQLLSQLNGNRLSGYAT